MEKDGNCFYTAIADQLEKKQGKQPKKLRKSIVKYMLANRVTFDPMVNIEYGEDLETYCVRMKKDGEWAGQPELIAAARFFRRDIEVYSAKSLEPQRFLAVENESTRIIRLSFHKGIHYTSLIEQKEQKDPAEQKEQKDPDPYDEDDDVDAKIDKVYAEFLLFDIYVYSINNSEPRRYAAFENENTGIDRIRL